MRSALGLCAAFMAISWLVVGCDSSDRAAEPTARSKAAVITAPNPGAPPCKPPQVQYTPYPGRGEGLSQLPWLRGEPHESGLVALLWYWPQSWQRQQVREARIFTGGVAPAGYNVKVMWVFLGRAARARGGSELVVEGQRLDGPGAFRDSFAAIGYAGAEGAPSYASIIDVPKPGCWRLTLATGALRAHMDFRAVNGET
jgi:hypothetical protein